MSTHHHRDERTHADNLLGKATTVDAIELAFMFSRVMVRLRQWNKELSDSFLIHLFGASPVLVG